ncbi:MAG: DUF6732 family protein [Planktotalea sp.]|uniref:DUF6732 family protein n=1 Tax=Planktotalea sp. TaxID=2029877 RepID=UPI003C724325
MKSVFYASLVMLWGNSLAAHPGHLAEVAGHGHWLGAAAIGAAIALGAWAALKGKKQEQSEAEDADLESEDLQEA